MEVRCTIIPVSKEPKCYDTEAAQVSRTDRLAVHRPDQEEPAHELQEPLPWELFVHGPHESSSGSSKTDLRCPGWFQGFGALPCPFVGV